MRTEEHTVAVGSKLTCDEYACILILRRFRDEFNCEITSQELLHVNQCADCTFNYSRRRTTGYSVDAAFQWTKSHALSTHNWDKFSDAKEWAEKLLASPIDYVRMRMAYVISGFPGVNQPYEWRQQQIIRLLDDPSFEVREEAAYRLAQCTFYTPELQEFGLQTVVTYAAADPMRTEVVLNKVKEFYYSNINT